jgi:hypothetical protein
MNYALWMVLLFSFASIATATTVQGRFTAGGYLATERFKDNDGGSNSNDSEVFSGRMFLKLSDISDKDWEATVDLRDKDDFFDKADKERLQLTGRDLFQIREMDTHIRNGQLGVELGRFPVQDAGAAGVDGGMAQYYHSASTTSAAFGGLNPKREDQTYYQFNPQDTIFGLLNTYQKRDSDWDHNFYFTHALVTEDHTSEVDRFYLFHNLIYQWNTQSRIISLLYLDFVPRTYIQNGNVLWQQGWSQKFSSQLSLLGIDVITYSRTQGVRETLAPSPYKEASLRTDYEFTPLNKLELGFSEGKRDADHLTKAEYYVGWEKNQLWSRHWDLFGKIGGRKNFISHDLFSNMNLSYFARKWETALDVEYGVEKYTDGVTKHPLTTELDLSFYLSRTLYMTTSFQRAADETVQILTGFFRIGYRFGNASLPPLRDGSPPRGSL